MFYALAKINKELADSLYKYIALAPCTIMSPTQVPPDVRTTFFLLPDIGVYSTFGPNWEDELPNKVCKNLSESFCNQMTEFTTQWNPMPEGV